MNRTLIILALLAHSLVLPVAGCGWWATRGKAEATTALACAETALAGQVAVLVSQVAAGDYSALTTVGEDVIACAIAALTQMPTPATARKVSPRMALQTELAIRKARR